ncbi:B1 bradykinin receptor-like isoform X2 [Petromyzon marinus]
MFACATETRPFLRERRRSSGPAMDLASSTPTASAHGGLNASAVCDVAPCPVNLTLDAEKFCNATTIWDSIYVFVPAAYYVILALGVVGNLSVILVLCLQATKRTAAEIYLLNLACADLLFVCTLPLWAINITRKYDWPFGDALCRAVGGLVYVNMYGSVYFLTAISVERYFAVAKPMSLGLRRTRSCARRVCLLVWAATAVFSLPVFVFRGTLFLKEYNITACVNQANTGWLMANYAFLNVAGFLLPLGVMLFCAWHIVQELRRSFQKTRQNEKRVTVLMCVMVLAFFICWMPVHFFLFLDFLIRRDVITGCDATEAIEAGVQILTVVGYANSCLNPLIYVFLGKMYRERASQILRRVAAFLRSSSMQNMSQSSRSQSVTTVFRVSQTNLTSVIQSNVAAL